MILKRKHAQWSASASERSFACAGSLTLIAAVEPAKESRAAAWGTAYHTVIEQSLKSGVEPFTLIGTAIKTDEFEFEVDEEMADSAQVSTDYIRKQLDDNPGAQIWLEELFDLKALGFPFETGGTSDCAIWKPVLREVEIIDHKGGRGYFVEIRGNPQPPHYALGFMVKHPQLPVEKVRMTIIQPRIPSSQGVIRSVTTTPADLVDFANDILDAQIKSRGAMEAFLVSEIDAWAEAWLKVGNHCHFCPASGQCPALRARSQEMVNMYWEDDLPVIPAAKDDPGTVERDLDAIELLEQWIASRRAYAHSLAQGGHVFDHWALVHRNGHRKWNDSDAEAARRIVDATKLSDIEIYTRKLKSPAGIEKMLGAGKGKIADLFHTPITGTDLVRVSKAGSRRPAKSLVDEYFNS